MFDKVLVLADGEDPQQPAIRRALECVADGGEIEVFAVVYEPMLEAYLGNREIYEPLRQRVLKERLERAAALARAVESHGVRGSARAVWSHPMHVAVAAEVAASGADLVVAAPANLHQSGGASSHGLSHSDWQVVTSSGVPLLLVKSAARLPYRTIAAAIDPFHRHAKPGKLDEAILRCAKAMQTRTGATLTAVHCQPAVEYFGADLALGAPDDAQLSAIDKLCADAGIADRSVVAGSPHRVLTEMQTRGDADLVVMGALARGRIAELVLGHTAERVLHYGTGDVMVVPAAPTG